MPLTELVALLLFATAMSFTPGPNTTLSAALGANGGWPSAWRFVCAVPVGWGLLLLATALGLGGLVQAAPGLKLALKAVGLAYMTWLALKLWRASSLPGARSSLQVGFWQGVALQFVNAKAWFNALLINAGWVTSADDAPQRFAVILPILMAYGFASNWSYAMVGSALRAWLAQGHRLQIFNRSLALLLLATALWMAFL